MLGIIWYILYCTQMISLISFVLLYIYFFSLLSCFRGNDKYQQHRVDAITWNSPPNIFPVNKSYLLTELCFIHSILILSRLRVWIKWIEYCSSILSSNKIIKCVEWVEIKSCFINKIFSLDQILQLFFWLKYFHRLLLLRHCR